MGGAADLSRALECLATIVRSVAPSFAQLISLSSIPFTKVLKRNWMFDDVLSPMNDVTRAALFIHLI